MESTRPVTAESAPQPAGDAAGTSDAAGTPSGAFRIATLGGIPLFVSWTWFLIAGVIVLFFGPDIDRVMPGLGAGAYLVALAYAVVLLIAVLAHEASHAISARLSGYQVRRIVVNLWGGHTAYESVGESPGRSALIAASGPAANAVLALLGYLALPLAEPGVGRLLLLGWTLSNAFVAVFNLLPGLPLDGGWILDAAIWKLTGRQSAGRIAAGWGGRIVAAGAVLVFVVVPMVRGERVGLTGVATVALVGAFLWTGASHAIASGRAMRALERLHLADLLLPCWAVPRRTPLAEIAGLVSGARSGSFVPVIVDDDGSPLGLLDPQALRVASRSPEPAEAALVVQPRRWVVPAGEAPSGSVAPYVDALAATPYGVVVLRREDGELVGVLTAADVVKARDRAASPRLGERRPA